jgi:PAS domain S-box-containing protein
VLAQNFKEIGAWQSTSLLDDCLAALKFNTCHQREARAVSSFGKEQWFEYRILPRHLKGQNHLLIQFFDLTERKHAEKALRASEAHFRMLAEGMVDVVWKADRAMRFTYINDADFHLRGFSREEVVGHPIADTLMPEGQAILSEVMAERRELEARGDRDHDLHFIVPQRCKDGRVIWADVLSIPIYDSDGQIEGYQGIGRDVTERIRCEESRVSQARKEEQSRLGQQIAHLDRQRALGELAASLGHELNQPLAAILTNVQVVKRGLKRGRMDDAQLTEFLDKIAQSTKRASQIIERIRNYIRPSRTDHEPVNLNAVVAEVIKLMADDARSRKVSVVPPATAAPVMVTGDAIQLSQIVLNVMRNAFDSVAQVARREVYVSCSQANDRAIVRVRDTGTGLAPETLIEVGKAFFTTKSSGLGMGFSISRSIAQQHGGSLTLSNADSSEGSGAIVELNLPALSPTNP